MSIASFVHEDEEYNKILKETQEKVCSSCVIKMCCTTQCYNFWCEFFKAHGTTLTSIQKF